MKEFIFIWSVENISFSWYRIDEPIFSPSFIAYPLQNTTWALKLYPKGQNSGDYLSLFLYRSEDHGPENLSINFELSCISAENSPLHLYTFLETDTSFTKNVGFGHPRFMRYHEVFIQRKALYLPRDTLTLRCRMWKNEGDANESGESYGFTRIEIERCLSVENIKFQIQKENTVYIHSRNNYSRKALMSIIILYNEGSIQVTIKPSIENSKFLILKLLFLEKSNNELFCEHTSSWLGVPRQEIWRLSVQAHGTLNEYLAEKDLELRSEIIFSTGNITEKLENAHPNSPRLSEFVSKFITTFVPSGNLSKCPGIMQELWNLYIEHIICDVELKTQTKSFLVHKIVLCARSPVFLAMFTGDMKETRSGCIEIEDIADDILDKFLFFLYTDNFQDLEWEAVIGLYYAADKYQVERLKILCCSYLLNNVDVDNVRELLILADRHHDSDFKRRVEDFILENDVKIFCSQTWKKFVYQEPLLSAETMLLRYDQERGKDTSAETYEEKLSRLSNALDDFRSVYDGKILNDIIIKSIGATFPAHKSVLCASSTKLRETFTNAMWDKSSNIFEIQDLEDDIFSRMLKFLYTDSLENMEWDNAIKLYHAANIFEIQRLNIKCSCFLLENLKTSNASDLLLLAYEYSDVKLKSVVEDFILLHDEEIFGSDEWAQFCKNNLLLANETMRLKYTRRDIS